MQKNNAQNLDIEFWERMDILIGDERPYPWAEAKGINKSSFQSARARQKKPLPKTVKAWAEKIGCNYEWLNTGIGQPFNENIETAQSPSKEVSDELLKISLLAQAFETMNKALSVTNRTMSPEAKAKFVVSIYSSLNQENRINLELLQECIYTVEQALLDTRRTMTSNAKSELILIIYDLYYGNTAYKEAIKTTLDELIRSTS